MSVDISALVTENLEIWTSAVERKSGAGRGGSKKISPYGIDRLRALILDLAVRGKLVRQNSRDEPATRLLESIRAERATLAASKVIGKGKAFPPASAKPPFDLPASWVWVQVSDVGHDWGQRVPEADFTYIDVGSINQSLGSVANPAVLSPNEAPSRARKIVRRGTVIYSTVRPYLRNIAIVDQDFDPEPIASTAFAISHPYKGVSAGYVFHYLRSPAFVRYVESCQTGIAYPAINDRQFFAAWFPLPPAAEQQRIAAKVDELLALCDAMEAQSISALEAHQRLVETLLATLLKASDADDLAKQWQRLNSHFDALFTTEASIEALRQVLLELAIRGKLVNQFPAEEQAHLRLGRARTQAVPPFDIPSSWSCISLGNLGEFRGGGTPSKSRSDYWDGPLPWVSPKDMKHDYLSDAQLHVSEAALDGSAIKIIPPHSILFVVRGMILAHSFPVGIGLVNLTINQDMKALILDRPEMSEYVLRALKGLKPYVLDRVERSGHGTCRLDSRLCASIPVPIPPLAEQRVIVAKLDELMALCDALKTRLGEAEKVRRDLAAVVVEKAA